MAIVQPGNDAFQQVLKDIATGLGRPKPILKAVAVFRNVDKRPVRLVSSDPPKITVRLVTLDPNEHASDRLLVRKEMKVDEGKVTWAITILLGANDGNAVVVGHEHLAGNEFRWFLQNPITGGSALVNGKEIAANYRNVG